MPGMIRYEDSTEIILMDVDKISTIKERISGKHPGAGDQLAICCDTKHLVIDCSLEVFIDVLKKAKKAKTFEYYSLKSGKVIK